MLIEYDFTVLWQRKTSVVEIPFKFHFFLIDQGHIWYKGSKLDGCILVVDLTTNLLYDLL